jgi:cold shock CspA family protein
MAKSQETYLKKDKEKNKQKKRQDKLLKKEERKASSKGGSLESMMAYVDEFGNITDEPIDPKLRKAVNAESIEIGVQRREAEEPEDQVRKGKVAFFNTSKGYGFIKDLLTQESIFVHINGLIDSVNENDNVTFERMKGPKGWNAVKVKKA